MAEAPDKLVSHILGGEPHITQIEVHMQAALALAEHIGDAAGAARKARNGRFSPGVEDGLIAVLDTIADHVGEVRTWWRQLHELGVVQPREKADG